jgi:hypothetical protein
MHYQANAYSILVQLLRTSHNFSHPDSTPLSFWDFIIFQMEKQASHKLILMFLLRSVLKPFFYERQKWGAPQSPKALSLDVGATEVSDQGSGSSVGDRRCRLVTKLRLLSPCHI